MSKPEKYSLSTLYKGSDINQVWTAAQTLPVIEHPKLGWISPNQFRSSFVGKPCPFCGQMMVQGQTIHSTNSKKEAIARGYQYKDIKGDDCINQIESTYFHPNYITLDHKLNKARCPELLFDYKNLQAMCWKCNLQKGDNNNFEVEHTFDFVSDLASEALDRYQEL